MHAAPERDAAAQWQRLRRALDGRPLPSVVVDLDALERNVDRLAAPVRASGKRLRLATKSVRCPSLIEKIVARLGDPPGGLMTYSASESAFWSDRLAAPDLLLAYPTVQPSDLAHLVAANRRGRCAVVADDLSQVVPLAAAGRAAGLRLPVAIEVDLSWRPLGGALHVGVRRSPIRDPQQVVELARAIAATDGVSFAGWMGYEAHVAGLTDRSPFHGWQNGPRRAMKRLARGALERTRAAVNQALAEAGLSPSLVNGGGTGSVGWAAADGALTEVTCGSGCLDPHLFDYYAGLALEPASWFALQVVRRPAPGIVTCHGGGYIASGDGGRDRLPLPDLPPGCRLLSLEGAGEVQTPVQLPPGVDVAPGQPILFRHAKAGELAEHFNDYLLVRGDQVVEVAPTYRGLGYSFLG